MKLKICLWLVLWLTVCNSYASVTWKVWNTDYRVDTTFHAKNRSQDYADIIVIDGTRIRH